MKLPFIQHIGIGLHISSEAIRWVELYRLHDQVRIRSVHVEIIKEGDIKQSLSKLIETIDPGWKFVTVNMDSSHVRQKLIEVPGFEDEEYLEAWVREQKEEMVPEGLNKEDFVVCHRFIGLAGENQRCLLLITSKEAVESRINLLKAVGLQPIAVTSGDLEAGYAYLFDPDFTSGNSCLIKAFEDYSSVQFYSEGVLTNFIELSGGNASAQEIIYEAETYLATSAAQDRENLVVAISKKFLPEGSTSFQLSNYEGEVKQGNPLSNITGGENSLDSDYSVAAGMAIKQVYPALDSINFLVGQRTVCIREKIRKKDALHTGLALGGIIIILFTLLMTAQYFLQSKLNAAQQQVILLDDKITAVDQARANILEMKTKVNSARKLIGERSNVAGLLEMVGRSVPQRVWLNEVNIHKAVGAVDASVYGFAYNDALVASLMERMENEQNVKNVRLIVSETVAVNDVYSQFNTETESLVHFQIRMSVNPKP